MSEQKPLVITKEDEIFTLFPRLPILTNLQTGWQGISFGYMCQPASAFPEVSTSQCHSLVIFTHGARVIHAERKMGGRRHRDAVCGGDIVITPVNVGHEASWEAEGDFILLGIEQQIVAHAVEEAADADQIELVPHFATPDPLVYQIGLALKSVLENNPSGSRLYAETMVNALSVHLIQHYSTGKLILKAYKGLPRRQLQQVIDYIHAHLEQNLGLAELATLIPMSPHYFSLLFKQATGMAPHKYVIHCRVERAKELLLKGEIAIAEIARLVGFASQSHLNFHCKRLLGVTPKTLQQR
ncbi:AraC family transcriptional regulator [aff. Roholtiella sp. LEGE 12411]|uniref:AraC family transcriptional regulator n=1 Tax=aff. Roholtiella sp. LEGE 12411 TaxID=1828822 RepID=UPI00187E2BBD|nr:AraC family transcriptional regulator [aff. Roholtiella sp. LEGE 12411]MBE9037465.1 helix-turn-helix transcriptional regulator [aff. Roholtiella sp. LEGE 12411]